MVAAVQADAQKRHRFCTGANMDDYEQLRLMLHKHPAGAPRSATFTKILKFLFTPQEARVALGMGFVPRSPSRIAAQAGLSEAEVQLRCESMADKGIVYAREKDGQPGYALLPTIKGLFEFPLMKDADSAERRKLGELWQQYHTEAMGNEYAGSATPLTRVIPIEEAIVTEIEIYPYESLSKMLDRVETFALAQCACRSSIRGCEKPLDVCLIFDKTAEFLIARKIARRITREEAEEALARAEQAGLVHTVNNSREHLTLICNCCSCCCTVLRTLTQLGNPNAIAKSRWQALVDAELCTGCGICADERCQIGAVVVNHHQAHVDPQRCIGCGLCATACPEGAIQLITRPAATDAPPATIAEMRLQVATEKNRLDDFLPLLER
jgi:electron transport complex protein RnfB